MWCATERATTAKTRIVLCVHIKPIETEFPFVSVSTLPKNGLSGGNTNVFCVRWKLRHAQCRPVPFIAIWSIVFNVALFGARRITENVCYTLRFCPKLLFEVARKHSVVLQWPHRWLRVSASPTMQDLLTVGCRSWCRCSCQQSLWCPTSLLALTSSCQYWQTLCTARQEGGQNDVSGEKRRPGTAGMFYSLSQQPPRWHWTWQTGRRSAEARTTTATRHSKSCSVVLGYVGFLFAWEFAPRSWGQTQTSMGRTRRVPCIAEKVGQRYQHSTTRQGSKEGGTIGFSKRLEGCQNNCFFFWQQRKEEWLT